ncbi:MULTISPECIES: TolC family protein [unclassified Mesorhizobium]|uniref:TolC family protein n=3 Tax=Mesorhizobium TaxID=68287 RepID=UPI000FCB22F2|nr:MULTISPECIES: TolC family protein [unclassified Mesorhizobium]RUU62101.1 TolC family protein [Mesorhizobium sp. M7A.T.Ca.TU.009.01.1.1]RUU85904.1 TolC family protein [Mesorhizobium sp. M7A.T.Ca.TU.009.01.1.2]RUT82819.1 TolC family protein [Mesorhizobium sp. M7A.T.Ca.US.000.02.1.1]RUU06078.1 TolC family protein [Mesorhizobium sp. M7A.T.Ca.TU.009.02.1.1]RUV23158.1 TolC family protein [Mesorhizobium sp. M7A.F.Ca.MR.245.00.0.0]
MKRRFLNIAAAIAISLIAAGCATTAGPDDVSDPVAGFTTVAARAGAVTGKRTVWVRSREEAQALSVQVKSLVRKKTIGPDVAVQVALLNNKGLQAAYAEIGLSAADVWQEGMLVNPTISVGTIGIDPVRTIEGAVASNILALMTRQRRVAVADTRFRQAQLRAAEETLRLAADTRRAWINAVSARESVSYLNQAQAAADAASELAQKLGETGAFTKTGQAREHVFYAEITGQAAEARLAARAAKEELTRLMGLWGPDVDYSVPDTLPALPKGAKAKRAIEGEALKNRVDLEIAKLELEALAKSHGLTEVTRYVTDLELLSGVEVEREESEEDGTETSVSPTLELEFVIPIFDTGKARMRKAELAYMQAANRMAEKAINIRSEARSAYDAYRSTYDIARHYRNSVVPLRTKIEAESVLTYNGMITNTFELLADTRAKISSIMLSLNAKRNFWLADVNLGTAIHGGGASAPGGGDAPAAAEAGAQGH